MSTYVVRPIGMTVNPGGLTPADAATIISYIGDNSDATFVYNNGTAPKGSTFLLSNPTVAAGEFVSRIGFNLRWKGDSAGNYSIGGIAYRANTPSPGYYPSLTPNNSAAFTSTQVGLQPVTWSVSELNQMRYDWFDGRSNAAWGRTDTADVWATIYTLATATATPANRTETSSVFPTITVNTSTVIDWEAGSYEWQSLRKVTVEVRIEQGGTGLGTGTLVSSGSGSVFFSATGTQAISVTMPDALDNGTYKVYARALRYREDGIAREDQYGAWSAAATLTMSAPAPVTPTFTATSDQTNDRVALSITPIASTGYSGPYIYVERSEDGGFTWLAVRGASGVVGSYGVPLVVYDYEAPRDQTVYYRAMVEATYFGFINSSAWTEQQYAFIAADTWNLKHATNAVINAIGVNVVGRPGEQVSEDLGVFRPLGRKYPVVVGGTISGWDGNLNVICTSDAEWYALKTLVESQGVLLLESVFGWSKYVRLLSGTNSALYGSSTMPVRSISLNYVEVQKPAVVSGETQPTQDIPNSVDGGTATSTFAGFYDGGDATSTPIGSFDGGDAGSMALFSFDGGSAE